MAVSEKAKFEFLDRMMKSIPKYHGREQIPENCSECMYYQPKWKYRHCRFAKCKYKESYNPFRRKPLKDDRFSNPEVVIAGAI